MAATSSRAARATSTASIPARRDWDYAKRRLSKFNGINGDTFYLHLKESEYRFNHRRGNLYAVLLTMLRREPL